MIHLWSGERDSTGGGGGWEGNCVTTCQGFVPGRQSSLQEKVSMHKFLGNDRNYHF